MPFFTNNTSSNGFDSWLNETGLTLVNNSSSGQIAYSWGNHSEAGYLSEAPLNENFYARKSGAWEVIGSGGGIETDPIFIEWLNNFGDFTFASQEWVGQQSFITGTPWVDSGYLEKIQFPSYAEPTYGAQRAASLERLYGAESIFWSDENGWYVVGLMTIGNSLVDASGNSYLTNYTETDPIFSSWLQSDGTNIVFNKWTTDDLKLGAAYGHDTYVTIGYYDEFDAFHTIGFIGDAEGTHDFVIASPNGTVKGNGFVFSANTIIVNGTLQNSDGDNFVVGTPWQNEGYVTTSTDISSFTDNNGYLSLASTAVQGTPWQNEGYVTTSTDISSFTDNNGYLSLASTAVQGTPWQNEGYVTTSTDISSFADTNGYLTKAASAVQLDEAGSLSCYMLNLGNETLIELSNNAGILQVNGVDVVMGTPWQNEGYLQIVNGVVDTDNNQLNVSNIYTAVNSITFSAPEYVTLLGISSLGIDLIHPTILVADRILETSDGTYALNWESRKLIDTDGGTTSIDWANRQLSPPNNVNYGFVVADWSQGTLRKEVSFGVWQDYVYGTPWQDEGYLTAVTNDANFNDVYDRVCLMITSWGGNLNELPANEIGSINIATQQWVGEQGFVTTATDISSFADTNGYLSLASTAVQGTPWQNEGYYVGDGSAFATATQGGYADNFNNNWGSTTNNSANWDTAYGWGNHADMGYVALDIVGNLPVAQNLDFGSCGTMGNISLDSVAQVVFWDEDNKQSIRFGSRKLTNASETVIADWSDTYLKDGNGDAFVVGTPWRGDTDLYISKSQINEWSEVNDANLKIENAVAALGGTFDGSTLTYMPTFVTGTPWQNEGYFINGNIGVANLIGNSGLKTDYTAGDLDTEAKIIDAINATNDRINAIAVILDGLTNAMKDFGAIEFA